MLLGGIDGCKGGWLVIFKNEGTFSYEVISSIEMLNQRFLQPSRFFIDMPIGLSSEGFTRTLETTLRTELNLEGLPFLILLLGKQPTSRTEIRPSSSTSASKAKAFQNKRLILKVKYANLTIFYSIKRVRHLN